MADIGDRDQLIAELGEGIAGVNYLHKLAVRCVNAVVRLHYMAVLSDGIKYGREALGDLEAVVGELPPLPLEDDPFCVTAAAEISGIQATSVHAAAFDLAKLTLDATRLYSLEASDATDHQAPDGGKYTRVTFRNVGRSWREVEWSEEVWQRIGEQLRELPSVDHGQWQQGLHFERHHQARRVGDRRAQIVLTNPSPRRKRSPTAKQAAATQSRKMQARNRWIYNQCKKGDLTYDEIVGELRRLAPERGWPLCQSKQRIRQIANEFAQRHDLPLPRPRQNL